MLTKGRNVVRWAVLLGAAVGSGCVDAPTERAMRVPAANQQAVKFWDALASTRWNQRATDLLQSLPVITGANGLAVNTPSNGQAWASRTLTYLSLAQYRAMLATTDPSVRSTHPSVSAAVASASFDVLMAFFGSAPSVPDTTKARISTTLQQLRDSTPLKWPGEANEDVGAGVEIGHAVGTAVWTQSQNDGYLTAATPFAAMVLQRGVRATDWHPAPGAIVRSLWGVTPFFLQPEDFLLSPNPPAYNSPEFQTALDEVYMMRNSGTPAELADRLRIALLWNKVPPSGPYTAGEWNRRADDLIRSHHRTEAEATRILAYANAAAFDAQIDCFRTKYTWWVRRPAQVNNLITTAFATPNHPSYPSGHSCISSAFGAVLTDAFPSEREELDSLVKEAGMSRIYAGIHYRFDIEAGQGVGRRAAAKALAGSLK